jgi:DNA-directed RNA polymerase specialized sigma24 family protein
MPEAPAPLWERSSRHTLPPRERAVMALFNVLDLSVREVAAQLGVASATVRVHLRRGRRHLAALLSMR